MAVFGQWQFEFDPKATQAAYARVDHGGSERCICNGCRNFVVARSHVFPRDFLELLTTLGVDPLKDGEAYHNARLAPGRHDYAGWYHFVGQLTVDGDFGEVNFGGGFTASLCKPNARDSNLWKVCQLYNWSFIRRTCRGSFPNPNRCRSFRHLKPPDFGDARNGEILSLCRRSCE